MAHKVTAPLVIAKNEGGSDVYLYEGAEVPNGLAEGELKRLKDGEFVEEVKDSKDEGDKKPAAKKS